MIISRHRQLAETAKRGASPREVGQAHVGARLTVYNVLGSSTS